MSEPGSSPTTRVQTRVPKKKAAHVTFPPKVNLSVQDRRHKTRLLNETQRRKDQLLGLTTYDVAAHLHRYAVEPSAMMDESREGCVMPPPKASPTAPEDVHGFTGADVRSGGLASSPAEAVKGRDANTRWHTQYAQRLQEKKSAMEHGSGATPSSSSAYTRQRHGEEPHLRGGDVDDDASGDEDATPLPLPPASYDEWLTAGCPTGSWAALLEEEVYAPVAAEKALLAAKYDPKGSLPETVS